MFREMRRAKQQLTKEECIRILKENKRCVLAVLGDSGYPYAIPLNYFYDETSGKIYFHGAKSGHKIDALHKNSKRFLFAHMITAILKKATGLIQ